MLSGFTPKNIQKYHDKGIFTVKQLSHIYLDQKQSKRSKKSKIPLRYRPELQALAIRTEKNLYPGTKDIKNEVELFLDIEGIPDQFYYLIGLLVSSSKEQSYYSFWPDSKKDEEKIWDNFIEEVNKYPGVPNLSLWWV
ncbi:MAG: ribonuclease H-like domain-containing protein [Chromatiales bacterium]|nr:ribonuclease H-like domain-containing protein [Chromatiales bacterium]